LPRPSLPFFVLKRGALPPDAACPFWALAFLLREDGYWFFLLFLFEGFLVLSVPLQQNDAIYPFRRFGPGPFRPPTPTFIEALLFPTFRCCNLFPPSKHPPWPRYDTTKDMGPLGISFANSDLHSFFLVLRAPLDSFCCVFFTPPVPL